MAEQEQKDTVAPDLEKARDEKCIPIARSMFQDIVDGFGNDGAEDNSTTPITMKIMQKALTADLNISTEVPYLFQLVLGIFSGLNSTIQKVTASPTDIDRYASLTRRMLAIVAAANVKIGNVIPEDTEKDFAPVLTQINDLFKAENVTSVEIKFIMDNIFQSYTRLTNTFNELLAQSSQKAEAKLFGIEFMSDLTMAKLNEVLLK